ncbi:MAG: hydroxyisourate hydrolase [Myxococcales bacterium]|nr:hydroxyisourate hydrolase [Myxococcales bacterium]
MITTHVLDTAQGRPASGIPVRLEIHELQAWTLVGRGTTDADGRLESLGAKPQAGTYRLIFDTRARSSFFPEVTVMFEITDANAHYHVPLLLSPFGYSTYRGS